jgi:hypothetical protein
MIMFGFDFVMVHMLRLESDFNKFDCYDLVICHVIFSEQEYNSVRFQFGRNCSVSYENNALS